MGRIDIADRLEIPWTRMPKECHTPVHVLHGSLVFYEAWDKRCFFDPFTPSASSYTLGDLLQGSKS